MYKIKCKLNGEVERCKARLAKGYKQKPGIHYFEVFAPVARLDTVRMILSCCSKSLKNISNGCEIGFLDEWCSWRGSFSKLKRMLGMAKPS